MDSENDNLDIAYFIPYKYEELTLKIRHTANAWWKDVSKVYRLLDAFDNHDATIEEACDVAGISLRQYKYFAQMHPLINDRRLAAKIERKNDKSLLERSALVQAIYRGDFKASTQWLRFIEPEEYDSRYKSTYQRLRRMAGLPAHKAPPKSEAERFIEMEENVEKTRRDFLSGKL